jgi:non-homologous end joining protein Ku
MMIVVIGGTGLIGKKLIPKLRKRGHEVVSASPSSGVNIRPTKELLTMSCAVPRTSDKEFRRFASELQESKITAPEIKLAGDLVESFTSPKIDFSEYRDLFTERVKEVVEAKLKGHRIESRRIERTGPVVNLMDALRQSIKKKAESEKGRHARKPSQKNKAG